MINKFKYSPELTRGCCPARIWGWGCEGISTVGATVLWILWETLECCCGAIKFNCPNERCAWVGEERWSAWAPIGFGVELIEAAEDTPTQRAKILETIRS